VSAETPRRHGVVLDPTRRWAAAFVLLVALAVRVAAVAFAPDVHRGAYDKVYRYDPIALNIIKGEGFSFHGHATAYSAPLYPLLLAGIYGAVGKSDLAAYLVLAILDAATCVIFFAVARRLLGGDVAILTAVVMVVMPYLVYSVLLGGSDTLFIFLNALFLWIVIRGIDAPSVWTFAAGGVVLGLASLARANSLLLPLFIVPILVFRRPTRRWLALTLAFLLAYAASLTPWTVRNYLVFDRFVPVQTLGGVHLLRAAPRANEHWSPTARDEGSSVEVDRADYDAGFYGKALQRILSDPLTYLKSCATRLRLLWYVTQSQRFQAFITIANPILLALAACGVVLARRQWRGLLPLYAIVGYYNIVQCAFVASFRYLLPIIPMIIILATVPCVAILQMIRRRVGWEPAGNSAEGPP